MKCNAKRILSFVLVLLMSLSMLTGIVLPAASFVCGAASCNHVEEVPQIYEGKEPTCGSDGLAYIECKLCGQILNANYVIPSAGEHIPGEPVADRAATCTTAGEGRIACAVCSKDMGRVVIPAGHKPGKWISLQPGKEAQICADCEAIIVVRDVLPNGSTVVEPVGRFTDVSKNDWYYKAVEFVAQKGLFNGTSATEFGPETNMTRGMFVTVLGRLHGVAETKASTRFTDVKKSDYFSGYVAWAAKSGIVNGTTDKTFAPNANINREQICAIMVRYMNYAKISAKKINTKITFKDASSISDYAKAAVATCQTGGIINGIEVSGGYNFDPRANATRAQVATIMMNFYNNYVK